MSDGHPMLSTRDISCTFGALRAVDAVSLDIHRGTITGLIGPNGAGKTTFFNLLAGALKPSGGSVHFDGHDVTGMSPDRLFQLGLARTFQIPRPFRRLSVLENLLLAPPRQSGETLTGAVFRRGRMREEERVLHEKAMGILDFMTLADLADQPAGKISGGQTKLLELARALMGEPSLILLDEPAAGVNPTLTNVLIDRIRELNRQGMTFFIVEHDMDLVMQNCDPVIALAEGRVVFEGSPEDAQADAGLLDAYLGTGVI